MTTPAEGRRITVIPAARARSQLRRVAAQARFETAAVLRNGEQLLLTVVLPVIALVVLVRVEALPLGSDRVTAALAGVLALAVASTAFTSQAIAIAFDRRWGVLRLLATTPLGPRGLLAGKLGAVLAVLVVQVTILTGTAAGLGWRPSTDLAGLVAAAATAVLGTAAFVALAGLVGGTLRPEAVLAVANLAWVVFAGTGLLLPTTALPAGLGPVARLLPSGVLGDGLRTALSGDGADPVALAALAGWALVGGWLAARFFRWE